MNISFKERCEQCIAAEGDNFEREPKKGDAPVLFRPILEEDLQYEQENGAENIPENVPENVPENDDGSDESDESDEEMIFA